jgi:thymidylate synthase
MFQNFEGATANDAWLRIAETFREESSVRAQPSRAGSTREILHACITIDDPRQRWVPSRQPVMSVAFALAEIIWIIRGRNDSSFVNYFNSDLKQYAGNGHTYHGAYGHRLRRTFDIDQLDRAFTALKANPDSRQVVLQIWDARQDLPTPHGKEVAPDIPCNVSSILKVRNGKLEWLQVMRSNDLYRGLPYNLVQFTAVQEIMAGWLGLGLGGYHHISDSLHVYDDCTHFIHETSMIDAAENTDSLSLGRLESDVAFAILEGAAERIASPNTGAEELDSIATNAELPPAFQNILYVLCAEGARRRRNGALTEELIGRCSNAAYLQLFHAWLKRWGPHRGSPA